MKKGLSILAAMILLLTFCTPGALAAEESHHIARVHRARSVCSTCQRGWAAADSDGFCDNCETAQCGDPAGQTRPCQVRADKDSGICANGGKADCPDTSRGTRQDGHSGHRRGRGRHCSRSQAD